MKPQTLEINFFSGSSVKVLYENYSTVKEIRNEIMYKLNFLQNKTTFYGIYEICESNDQIEERFLFENDRISDIFSQWSKLLEESMVLNKSINFKLFLRIFLHYSFSPSDNDSVTMLYHQTRSDYLKGKFNLNEKEIVTLGSLILLVSFNNKHDLAYNDLQKNIDYYVPIKKKNMNSTSYWIQKIMELYSELNTSSKLEAKNAFIERFSGNPLFEAQQFEVRVKIKFLF